MTNDEYRVTQDLLIQAGRMVDLLDLNGFRDRIRSCQSVGAILDPTLYRAGARNLEAINELAAAGIRLKAAFQALKSQVALELEGVANDA